MEQVSGCKRTFQGGNLKIGNDVQTPEERECPSCHRIVDWATVIGEEGEATPKEGDMSVCFYCAKVMIYTNTGFRKPTDKDWKNHQNNLANIIRAVGTITALRGLS